MKALSKPLSSPSRAEKFPPPLMRFLRGNLGSRSRGRSRSSPIFYLRSKKRPPGGVIETTQQEPSSPKVTCIGQVRVRRKKNGAAVSPRRCRWLNKTLFCEKSSCRFPKKPFGSVFCKWGLIFRSNCCRESGFTEEEGNFRVQSDEKKGGNENYVAPDDNNSKNNRNSISSHEENNIKYEENVGEGFQESKREFLESSLPSSCTPPKNALLLTRCRSAPYRSSSLGGRFWAEEKGEIIHGNGNEEKKIEVELEKPPRCENVVDDDDDDDELTRRNSEEMEKNLEEDLKANNKGGIAVHPLLLTRCKSEPARKGERFLVVNNTEENGSFLMQRRLDVIQHCSQHNSNS